MKKRLWEIKHFDLKQQAKIINAILMGHYNYYGFAGNGPKIQDFWVQTYRYWKRCLFRRSQQELSWGNFDRIMEKHPLRRPSTRVRYVDLAQYARL